MNLIYPALCDALVGVLRRWPDLSGVAILDGPTVSYAGNEGIAVGASREDVAGDFTIDGADLSSDGSVTAGMTSVAWASTGDTTFSTSRLRVGQLYSYAAAALAADRTIGGLVSTAWITNGTFDQIQSSGVLVFVEFRIEARVF